MALLSTTRREFLHEWGINRLPRIERIASRGTLRCVAKGY